MKYYFVYKYKLERTYKSAPIPLHLQHMDKNNRYYHMQVLSSNEYLRNQIYRQLQKGYSVPDSG